MLMILKSNHINKGDLKSKSFWKWWLKNKIILEVVIEKQNQNHIKNQMILKSFSKPF